MLVEPCQDQLAVLGKPQIDLPPFAAKVGDEQPCLSLHCF
jgi:hypothetical protein